MKNIILNVIPKFYDDTQNNVKVTATQTLENLYRFFDGSHAGEQPSAPQPIFPYNTIENVKISLANNSSTTDPTYLKFDRET